MASATEELRKLQQQALSHTVTRTLTEEAEALRVAAKEADMQRDAALREREALKEQLAGAKARAIAERKMRDEHAALASTSTSWQERISVLEMDNSRLAQDFAQLKAEAAAAKEAQVALGQERTAAAEREAVSCCVATACGCGGGASGTRMRLR